jgi:hypothetical protein
MLVRIAAALVAMAVTASGLKAIDLLAQVESAATSTAAALTRGKSTAIDAEQVPGAVLSATPED